MKRAWFALAGKRRRSHGEGGLYQLESDGFPGGTASGVRGSSPGQTWRR